MNLTHTIETGHMLLFVLFYGACNCNIKHVLHGNHEVLVSFQLEWDKMEVVLKLVLFLSWHVPLTNQRWFIFITNQMAFSFYVVKEALQQNLKLRKDTFYW